MNFEFEFAQVAKNKAFRKNIFTECSVFENSIFGKVAGKGQIVEFLKQPKFAEFPEIKTKSFLFATDGSLKKITKNKFFGSFSVVDAFNNYFFDTIELTEKTSSTHIEILALRSLFKSLSQVKLKNCTIIILVDSLSAIKLALGTDVRKEHLEILREIDGFRKKLLEKNVKDFFIHVRSHRNVSVFLNSQADMYAGLSSILEGDFFDIEKCAPECIPELRCEACQWNCRVNGFLRSFAPAPLHLDLWEKQ